MLFEIRDITFCNLLISWNKVFNAYSHIILIVPVSARFFNQMSYYDGLYLCSMFHFFEDIAGFDKSTKAQSYSIILYVTYCNLLLHTEKAHHFW